MLEPWNVRVILRRIPTTAQQILYRLAFLAESHVKLSMIKEWVKPKSVHLGRTQDALFRLDAEGIISIQKDRHSTVNNDFILSLDPDFAENLRSLLLDPDSACKNHANSFKRIVSTRTPFVDTSFQQWHYYTSSLLLKPRTIHPHSSTAYISAQSLRQAADLFSTAGLLHVETGTTLGSRSRGTRPSVIYNTSPTNLGRVCMMGSIHDQLWHLIDGLLFKHSSHHTPGSKGFADKSDKIKGSSMRQLGGRRRFSSALESDSTTPGRGLSTSSTLPSPQSPSGPESSSQSALSVLMQLAFLPICSSYSLSSSNPPSESTVSFLQDISTVGLIHITTEEGVCEGEEGGKQQPDIQAETGTTLRFEPAHLPRAASSSSASFPSSKGPIDDKYPKSAYRKHIVVRVTRLLKGIVGGDESIGSDEFDEGGQA
ncbi:Transcription factor TFIIH subunit p52/Tfb2 like protein, partial [Aduncisulcus paluster]